MQNQILLSWRESCIVSPSALAGAMHLCSRQETEKGLTGPARAKGSSRDAMENQKMLPAITALPAHALNAYGRTSVMTRVLLSLYHIMFSCVDLRYEHNACIAAPFLSIVTSQTACHATMQQI